jgi:hypothetical protein
MEALEEVLERLMVVEEEVADLREEQDAMRLFVGAWNEDDGDDDDDDDDHEGFVLALDDDDEEEEGERHRDQVCREKGGVVYRPSPSSLCCETVVMRSRVMIIVMVLS